MNKFESGDKVIIFNNRKATIVGRSNIAPSNIYLIKYEELLIETLCHSDYIRMDVIEYMRKKRNERT